MDNQKKIWEEMGITEEEYRESEAKSYRINDIAYYHYGYRHIDVRKEEFDEDVFEQMCEALKNGERICLNAESAINDYFTNKIIRPYLTKLQEKYPDARETGFGSAEAIATIDNESNHE